MLLKQLCCMAVLAGVSAGSIFTALAQSITGPSSSQSPYLVRTEAGVVTVSILTVGDAVNYKADGITPYRMVGIPDGLGAFDNGDGTFTVLMNHELASTRTGPSGIVRDHGFAGAFVSKWIIDKTTLTVLHGEDLMKNVYAWIRILVPTLPLPVRCSGSVRRICLRFPPFTIRRRAWVTTDVSI